MNLEVPRIRAQYFLVEILLPIQYAHVIPMLSREPHFCDVERAWKHGTHRCGRKKSANLLSADLQWRISWWHIFVIEWQSCTEFHKQTSKLHELLASSGEPNPIKTVQYMSRLERLSVIWCISRVVLRRPGHVNWTLFVSALVRSPI